MTWMAVLFLLSVCMLSVEVATGFGFLLKKLAPVLRGAALVAGGLLSVLALIQGMRAAVVQRYEVYLEGLPATLDGTVMVALSYLHLGTVLGQSWLAARAAQVQVERPNVVVLLGDVFEGHGQPEPALLAILRKLSARWASGRCWATMSRTAAAQIMWRCSKRPVPECWATPESNCAPASLWRVWRITLPVVMQAMAGCFCLGRLKGDLQGPSFCCLMQ